MHSRRMKFIAYSVVISAMVLSLTSSSALPKLEALRNRLQSLNSLEPCIIDSALKPSQPKFAEKKTTFFRERNGWCPYSERVWLALEAKGIDYDTVLIDNTGGGRPQWFSGTTPQIRWMDGRTQPESMDIIKQLDVEFSDRPLLYSGDKQKASEIEFLVNSFKNIFPRNTRPSSRSAFLFYGSGQPVIKSEFETTLTKTDELLGKYDGPFFHGVNFTAADCAWAPFLERYAAQLPLLHSGLNPRDESRWPKLAAWYDAMEVSDKTCFYASRVQGDKESWSKVLSMAGYGNDGVAPDLVSAFAFLAGPYESKEWKEKECRSFAQYASSRPYAEATPGREAAAKLLRNFDAITEDAKRMLKQWKWVEGVSQEDVEGLVFRGLIGAMESLIDGHKEASKGRDFDMEAVALVAKYLDERICIPRDMGALPAKEVRRLKDATNLWALSVLELW